MLNEDYAKACNEWRSSDGRVARASASGAVDSGLIPSRVKPMPLNLVFTASLFDAQHLRDRGSVEIKPVSSLVVSSLGLISATQRLGNAVPKQNIAAVASRWRHCVRFDRPGNRTCTYCSNSGVLNNYTNCNIN